VRALHRLAFAARRGVGSGAICTRPRFVFYRESLVRYTGWPANGVNAHGQARPAGRRIAGAEVWAQLRGAGAGMPPHYDRDEAAFGRGAGSHGRRSPPSFVRKITK
jgi:hypothetical protein